MQRGLCGGTILKIPHIVIADVNENIETKLQRANPILKD